MWRFQCTVYNFMKLVANRGNKRAESLNGVTTEGCDEDTKPDPRVRSAVAQASVVRCSTPRRADRTERVVFPVSARTLPAPGDR